MTLKALDTVANGRRAGAVFDTDKTAEAVTLVDASGNALGGDSGASLGKVDHSSTGLGNGKKVVASTGTAIAIASSTAAKWVTLFAYKANSADVYVGASDVNNSAVRDTGIGLPLSPGEKMTFPIDNLADVYVNGVSGDGVRFVYGT